jgi:hypothetical protein
MPTLINNDGLLSNIPMHLRAGKGQRSLRMNYCTLEERQQLKLHMAQEKILKVTDAKARLVKEIEKDRENAKKRAKKFDDFDMTEMRK